MIRTIVLGVDDSAAAFHAAAVAVELAAALGAALVAVSVVDGLTEDLAMPPVPDTAPSAEDRAVRAAQRHVRALAERAGLAIDTRTLHGQVADRLLTVARECGADLVVVGRQDRPGVRLTHVGRTAEQVLEFSAVPVLVVPMPRPRTVSQVVGT